MGFIGYIGYLRVTIAWLVDFWGFIFCFWFPILPTLRQNPLLTTHRNVVIQRFILKLPPANIHTQHFGNLMKPPPKNIHPCFSREYIFQPLMFRGHVSFQGSSPRTISHPTKNRETLRTPRSPKIGMPLKKLIGQWQDPSSPNLILLLSIRYMVVWKGSLGWLVIISISLPRTPMTLVLIGILALFWGVDLQKSRSLGL